MEPPSDSERGFIFVRGGVLAWRGLVKCRAMNTRFDKDAVREALTKWQAMMDADDARIEAARLRKLPHPRYVTLAKICRLKLEGYKSLKEAMEAALEMPAAQRPELLERLRQAGVDVDVNARVVAFRGLFVKWYWPGIRPKKYDVDAIGPVPLPIPPEDLIAPPLPPPLPDGVVSLSSAKDARKTAAKQRIIAALNAEWPDNLAHDPVTKEVFSNQHALREVYSVFETLGFPRKVLPTDVLVLGKLWTDVVIRGWWLYGLASRYPEQLTSGRFSKEERYMRALLAADEAGIAQYALETGYVEKAFSNPLRMDKSGEVTDA